MIKYLHKANTAQSTLRRTCIYFLKPKTPEAETCLKDYLGQHKIKLISMQDERFRVHQVYRLHFNTLIEFINTTGQPEDYEIFKRLKTPNLMTRADHDILQASN